MSELADDLSGKTLGRYRLDAFLGEGGMGRVYRAFDPTLGRAVAIKILPPALVHDRDRLERFIREARTASSLNHPNVVTIYEIGHEGETHFIAMELLEGETLRERGRIELRRAIDLIAQVADGVAAAHAVGVIHRDLKPENIIITKSGFAKILDFGLAKLRETPATAEGATTPKKTDPGTVLGSVGYMSPEQAAGREVDHRSDIFSLGCILYEAVSGRRAFTGGSSIDTLHKIIHDDPQPLRDLDPDVPPELQRIVRKCLAKDPDERYQSAKDLAIDLRTLRRDFDSQPRGVAPAADRRRPLAAVAVVVGVLAVLAVIAVMMIPRKHAASAPMSFARVTNSGNVIGAAISPDGKYVAYAYSDAGQHSIFVKQQATGSVLNLVPPGAFGTWGIAFAPDSQSVYYTAKSAKHPDGELYQIPIFGGTPRELLSNIDSPVAFSPDGKRLAFDRIESGGASSVVIANIDGSGERTLVTKSPPDFFAPIFWTAPAWSPDGKRIAAAVRNKAQSQLFEYDVANGSERQLSHDAWSFLAQSAFLHDGKSLVVVGSPAGSSTRQLWMLSYPEGQRRQLTNDLFDYRMTTLTSDDASLLTIAAEQTAAPWFVSLTGNTPPRKLTTGKYDGLFGVAASADQIVYSTLENERWSLWSVDPSGENRKQLHSEFGGAAPSFSPDGRTLVFSMLRDRDWVLMRSDPDGSNGREVCPISIPQGGFADADPAVTADGRWVIFVQAVGGRNQLWKVSIDGGKPISLGIDGEIPRPSPDGKLLAYYAHGDFVVAPIGGGPAVRTFNAVSGTTYSMLRWTNDSKALLHNAGPNDRKNVWLLPMDGSPSHPITHFDDQYILRFDIMPDGKALAVVRGVLSRDAVLIKNFR